MICSSYFWKVVPTITKYIYKSEITVYKSERHKAKCLQVLQGQMHYRRYKEEVQTSFCFKKSERLCEIIEN